MTDEYKQTAAEIYTRQHEFYAAQTAVALQFPIKLMLTLNSAAVAASLLLVRESLGSADATALVESVRAAFWAFGAGVICVLVASWFQWLQIKETPIKQDNRSGFLAAQSAR